MGYSGRSEIVVTADVVEVVAMSSFSYCKNR